MQIEQVQVTLLGERLQMIGVGRRELLKVVGALTGAAALGGMTGWDTPAQVQGHVPAGVRLAQEQFFRWATPNEPSRLDLNRYLYGQNDASLFAWLMKFDPNYQVIPWLAERYEVTPQGDVYTFYLRPGLKWSNGDTVTAHDFVWSYQRKLDPAVAADYVGFFYDIKNAEKINKGAITDLSQLGVHAPITWYLTPQATHAPFDDLRVRRAVSHAIDRKIIAEKVIQGQGIPAHAYIPPGLPGFIDATQHPRFLEMQRFDPKGALASLQGSKYEGGKNWPKITLTMRGDEGTNPKAMAEAIQAMLAQHLQMNVELDILEQRVFRERLWKLDLQFIFIRWFADYPDPHNEYYDTLYSKLASGRRQAWSNAQFDTLLEQGREELDWKKRLEIYMQAEEVLQQDVGYVPVVWGLFFAMIKPWVQGMPRNKQEKVMVDTNIYRWSREHMYIVEH